MSAARMAAAASLLIAVCAAALGDGVSEPLAGVAVPSADRDGAAESRPAPRLLVLKSGGVVSGRITREPDCYLVKTPSGSELFLPTSAVQFECRDLAEAYDRLNAALPQPPEAAAHVGLARWCVTNKLWMPARAQLKAALELDPERDDVRRMLRRVDELARAAAEPSVSDAPRGRTAPGGTAADDVRAVGGLSPEAASTFSRQIQPLLMNSCATASCHGPRAENPLKLSVVRMGMAGSHARLTERNLAAIMEYVDFENPDRSPLLTVPVRNHGSRSRVPFSGAKGLEQFKLLQEWVRTVAGERRELFSARTSASSVKPSSRVSPSAPRSKGEKPATVLPAGYETAELNGEASRAGSELSKAGGIDLAELEVDPFDPGVFNRETQRRKREGGLESLRP